MALDYYQKRDLDRMIEGKINSLIGHSFELKDFAQDCANINIPFNANSIYASLMRRMRWHREYNLVSEDVKRGRNVVKVWTIKPPAHLFTDDNTFTKERNILTFGCNKELTYDFTTGKFSFDLDNDCKMAEGGYNYLLGETKTIVKMLKYEWLFNYCNSLIVICNIHDHCKEEMYKAMPKDFIKNFGNEVTYDNLQEAYYFAKYGKYYKIARNLLDYTCDTNAMEFLFEKNGGFGSYVPLVKNSVLNGVLTDYRQKCYNLAGIYWRVVKEKNIPYTLDLNRDFDHNYEQLKAIEDKEKNEKLARKLQRLNFINGMTFGEYIVVVPQSAEEKADEGKQQNNCVGHYYDDSILANHDLIYFLRKVANPKKSYMTCRYHIQWEETAEFRLKNNDSVRDEREVAIIRQIDEIIKANLK